VEIFGGTTEIQAAARTYPGDHAGTRSVPLRMRVLS
jgi:hypothetical protein